MNCCSQAGCPNKDLRLFKLYLRDKFTLLCGSCHASLTAIGMSLEPAERRQIDLPVLVERRRTFRPAWLRHLTSRDETGRLAA